MPQTQLMHEVGVEGDLFNTHPRNDGCQRAGCIPAATLTFTTPHLCTFGQVTELRGWIKPCEEGRYIPNLVQELHTIGVETGTYDTTEQQFNRCRVPVESMAALDKLWGRYIWGLTPTEQRYKLEDLKANPELKAPLLKEPRVRIWSCQWGQWWRPGGSGYTPDTAEAGVFTFEEAWGRSNHAGPEKRIEYVVLWE